MKRYKFPLPDRNFFIHYNYTPYLETHCHNYWEFTIVTKGELLHKINKTDRIVPECTLLVIRPNDAHSLNQVEGHELAYLTLGVKESTLKTMLSLLGNDLYDFFAKKDYCEFELSKSTTIYFSNTFNNIQSDFHNQSTDQEVISTIFISIIRELLLCINHTKHKQNYSEAVNKFLELMRRPEHFPLSIEEIIQMMNYSHCHIIRLFKKETGMTPSQYFLKIKLSYAKSLLETTNLSVAHIASLVGFSSLGHFTKVFKEHHSLPPANYRKKW